jgi:hypothetical protein
VCAHDLLAGLFDNALIEIFWLNRGFPHMCLASTSRSPIPTRGDKNDGGSLN